MTKTSLSIPFRQRCKMWLGRQERIYSLYIRLRNPKNRFPSKETFMVIEGFPRSANTFSWYLAREVFPGKLIASHIHNIACVKHGLYLQLPCVIVFRAPLESVVSLAQKDGVSPKERSALEGYLQEWCLMHEFVLAQGSALALVEFGQAVDDPAAYACFLGEQGGRELSYTDGKMIADGSRRKMDEKESSKPTGGSSLPREERQREKHAYLNSVKTLPSVERAEELFGRLQEARHDLNRFCK